MKDLQKLVDLCAAETAYSNIRSQFNSVDGSENPETFVKRYSQLQKGLLLKTDLERKFKKIPKPRREQAKIIKGVSESIGSQSVNLGFVCYSGGTSKRVKWGDKPAAYTHTSCGDQYPGGKYYKTDALHVVVLSPEWSPDLVKYQSVADASRKDHCPLIGLKKIKESEGNVLFKAIWVTGGKPIHSKEGWLAARGDTVFHSVRSDIHALKGLKLKVNKAKEAERLKGLQSRGIAPLSGKKEIKLREIQALTGWCSPGCKAWLNRFMDGKIKAKPWEVAEAARKSNDSYGNRVLELIGAPKETIKYKSPNPHSIWTYESPPSYISEADRTL